MGPGPRQGRDDGHGDVIAQQQGSGAGAASAAIENEVISAGLKGEVEVGLDLLGTELEAHRDATGQRPHPIGAGTEIAR